MASWKRVLTADDIGTDGSAGVADGATGLVTGNAVFDYIDAQNFGTGSGDIEGVTAGSGLTDGGTSGTVTVNVGAGNGITVNADDVAVTAAQTTITSVLNTSLVIGRDSDNDIDFATDNNIILRVNGADQIVLKDGVLEPVTDNDVDLGSASKEFKNAYFDGTVKTDTLTVDSGGATITAGGLTVTAGGATVTAGGLTVSGGGATVTGDSTVTGALTVTGNLTVDGTTVFLDSSNVQTIDKVLRLAMEDSADNDYADTATAVAASTGSGLEVVTDTIANAANFAKLTWVNNTTTMTGWSVRDHNGTTYGIAALDKGAADPASTPDTGALFYNDGTSGTKGLYLYLD